MMTTLSRPAELASAPSSRSASVDQSVGRSRQEKLILSMLLIGTAALYLTRLSVSGWANQFYAAAASAGAHNWKAFLFGSLDQHNFITVDKPPASLWIIGLSIRAFGLSSWSVLAPQAVEGVASVAVLYAAVRRTNGPAAAAVAGGILALTPVATLMFRYDNPDALLVLLMTMAAYCTIRAVEVASAKWLLLASALLGFAFLTKMLQGMLVVPGLGIAYFVSAPVNARRRLLHLFAACATMVASAGWWVALVALWPTDSRPYVGGTSDNNIFQLILGYNGVGRLDGSDHNGGVGPQSRTTGFTSSQAGVDRLFDGAMGPEIGWLLAASLISLVVLIVLTRGTPRTSPKRASTIIWGGWLIVTGAVFSWSTGIIHPYYSVALSPAIAALVGAGVIALLRSARSGDRLARLILAGMLVQTGTWAFVLTDPNLPAVRWTAIGMGVAAGIAVWTTPVVRRPLSVTILIVLALVIAPAVLSLRTANEGHAGALPTVSSNAIAPLFTVKNKGAPSRSESEIDDLGNGLSGAVQVSPMLRAAIRDGARGSRWPAATIADNAAATLELATNEPVMAIGGYNGTDPAISLHNFRRLVTRRQIHLFVADPEGFIGSTPRKSSDAFAIERWVESHFTAHRVGRATVFDLSTSVDS